MNFFFFLNHNNFYEIKVLYSKPLIALPFIQTLLLLQLSLFLVPNSFKVSIAKPTEHTHTHTHTQRKMNCCALFLNSTIFPITINIKSVTFKNQSFFLRQSSVVSANLSTITKHKSLSSVHSNSLRVLEWDKLCDSVSSFATTSFGREATKVSLSLSLSLSQTLLQILNECFITFFFFFLCVCVRHSCGL